MNQISILSLLFGFGASLVVVGSLGVAGGRRKKLGLLTVFNLGIVLEVILFILLGLYIY